MPVSLKGGNGDEFTVRGWCPDAWRPMAAGDGLLLRVKPRLGRMTPDQVAGLCEAAIAHGSGLIDLTRRGNVQIRGVSEAAWPALLRWLVALDLVDADAEREGRRMLLVAPDWRAGDETGRIAGALLDRLDDVPDLPGKMGFVVDAGARLALAGEAGDFRIERAADGGLLLRADGRATGVAVAADRAADALIALSRWFVASGGVKAGRMARHDAPLPDWAMGDGLPAQAVSAVRPGVYGDFHAYAAAFGRVEARALLRLARMPEVRGIRVTPWRLLLVEGGARLMDLPGLSDDPAGALRHVDACPGMPACPQASVETRALAEALAGHVRGRLHVSGCAKGCACALPADVMVTGRGGAYDLSFNSEAGAAAVHAGLNQAQLLAHFGAA